MWPQGLSSLSSLHAWGQPAVAWPSLISGLSFSVHSLDLSELAKAAKKKLQAVSLPPQARTT